MLLLSAVMNHYMTFFTFTRTQDVIFIEYFYFYLSRYRDVLTIVLLQSIVRFLWPPLDVILLSNDIIASQDFSRTATMEKIFFHPFNMVRLFIRIRRTAYDGTKHSRDLENIWVLQFTASSAPTNRFALFNSHKGSEGSSS